MSIQSYTIDLDNNIVISAEAMLTELGLDLQTYIKMALVKLVRETAIPFDLSASQSTTVTQPQQTSSIQLTTPAETDIQEPALTWRESRQTVRITAEMCSLIWDEFKRRYVVGNKDFQDAARLINVQTGMNRGSAFIYFNILQNLVEGVQNTRALKYNDLVFFINKINTEFPEDIQKAAVTSLKLTIPYWDSVVPGALASKARGLLDTLQ